MGSEWPVVRLGDYCVKIGSGATPKGGKEAYLDVGPYRLIRSQNVYNEGFAWQGLAFISEEQARKLDGVSVEPGDVLVNITGDSVARVCTAPGAALPARVNQHVAIVRPRPDSFDADFLRWLLCTPAQQETLLGLASAGATRNALTKAMLEGLQVPMPPVHVQRDIAAPLVSIEKRIDLLHQTNATLESIAQALFKSWFIDFDPVRAKTEGSEAEGIDAATAELFQAELEESELGLIPKGWQVRSLDSFASYLNGLAMQKFPPKSEEESLPVIKIAQLRAGNTIGSDRASSRLKSEYIVQDGDVLFSWSGTLEVEVWCGGVGALNQHLFKVTSAEVPKWFYYLATRHFLPAFREIAAHKATTMGHIQRRHLTEARLALPPPALMIKLGEILDPLLQRRIANSLQARELSALRDTLLPRLISGQPRLLGAQAQLEEALA